MVGLKRLIELALPWRRGSGIVPAMTAKRLWTTEDLARHWHVTRSAVADRIARGKLKPDYIAQVGDRVMHLFDPERFVPK